MRVPWSMWYMVVVYICVGIAMHVAVHVVVHAARFLVNLTRRT